MRNGSHLLLLFYEQTHPVFCRVGLFKAKKSYWLLAPVGRDGNNQDLAEPAVLQAAVQAGIEFL